MHNGNLFNTTGLTEHTCQPAYRRALICRRCGDYIRVYTRALCHIQVRTVQFGQFLYFLAVPCLVYETKYPRLKVIRWRYVADKALGVRAASAVCHFLRLSRWSYHFYTVAVSVLGVLLCFGYVWRPDSS